MAKREAHPLDGKWFKFPTCVDEIDLSDDKAQTVVGDDVDGIIPVEYVQKVKTGRKRGMSTSRFFTDANVVRRLSDGELLELANCAGKFILTQSAAKDSVAPAGRGVKVVLREMAEAKRAKDKARVAELAAELAALFSGDDDDDE